MATTSAHPAQEETPVGFLPALQLAKSTGALPGRGGGSNSKPHQERCMRWDKPAPLPTATNEAQSLPTPTNVPQLEPPIMVTHDQQAGLEKVGSHNAARNDKRAGGGSSRRFFTGAQPIGVHPCGGKSDGFINRPAIDRECLASCSAGFLAFPDVERMRGVACLHF